jgi:Flp pilus assembly protein TadG
MRLYRPGRARRPRAAATVELAILAPFLAFLFVAVVDYARIFYHSLTVANCARNGALYGSDAVAAAQSPYTSLQQAALADAGNLTPTPTVTSTNGTDSAGNAYVEVTVTHDFQTIVNYPLVPHTTTISRTVRMRVSPAVPN